MPFPYGFFRQTSMSLGLTGNYENWLSQDYIPFEWTHPNQEDDAGPRTKKLLIR